MNYLFYILLQKTGESQTVEKLRTNLWDEENRLRAVDITPDAEGVRPIAIYTYDAGGERILKHSNTSVSIYLNGKKVADTIQVDATLYPSGMTVFRPSFGGEGGGAYTKHYYAGTQRVSSKIGTTENLGDFLQDWFTGGIGGPVDIIGSSFGVLENAENGVVQVYDELGIEPPTYDSDPVFIPVASFIHGNDENEIYWFHPDHLGSTSYITNLLGEVSQHMEYFAFGETFVEEHRSSNNSPYKFNGKELDEETGWYYYGARYYDPRISVWLSVDPLTEQTMTPYQYTYQNPINLIDPTGMAAVNNDWDNPVYGSDGTYRGNTKEGFTGEILIYDGDKEFSKMSALELEISGANKYDDTVLSNSAIEKIWTHIASNYEGVGIYDEVFSLKDLEGNKIHYNRDIDANWISSFYLSSGEGKISGSNLYSYESTVENIASSIIVHEWYSHIKKENRDGMKSHRLAYKNVINFKALWDKTTDAYKGFNMRQLRFYTEKETGRKNVDPLYQNLYNKYHNKY